eukprot:scaffold23151_cov35-Tisochrysis_lutea.AAC.3
MHPACFLLRSRIVRWNGEDRFDRVGQVVHPCCSIKNYLVVILAALNVHALLHLRRGPSTPPHTRPRRGAKFGAGVACFAHRGTVHVIKAHLAHGRRAQHKSTSPGRVHLRVTRPHERGGEMVGKPCTAGKPRLVAGTGQPRPFRIRQVVKHADQHPG